MKRVWLLAAVLVGGVALPCWGAGPCAASGEPAAVVQAQVEAYNRHDVEAFLNCYAEDATVEWLDGHMAPAKGMSALRAEFGFLGKIPAAGAGYGVDVMSRTITGPTVANVEHLRGLPPGASAMPDMLVIYEVREGKIVHAWFAPSK